MMSSEKASLSDVARSVGLSMMTVSRALRGAPKVAPATRERVLAAARSLGYEPDPHLARMMQQVRGKKRVRIRAVIAVVREYVPKDALLNPSYQYVPIEDIQRRANGYGYDVEEFWLGRDGLTPKRLQGVLHARGIEAVIVSPQSAQLPCRELDYSNFASVMFGYAMREPALHLSAGNLNEGIQMASARLTARGYRRLGLAVTRWIDERAQNGYSSGLYHFQQELPLKSRVPPLLMEHNQVSRNYAAFAEWMKKHEPDVVISFNTDVPDWLRKLGYRIPEDVGFLVHDWTPKMTGYAGLYQRRDHLAAAAVDLLVAQLMHNERGVPEVQRQLMFPPQWIDGPSVRGG